MIEIKKINDEKIAQKICEEQGLSWNPNNHVIATLSGEKWLNSAVFSYSGEEGIIHSIQGFDGDLAMLDGLCRAILNIMDINSVKCVYFTSENEELAKKVGFSEKNGQYYIELEGFFGCGCCKAST